jgi:hypothetical protein
MSLLYFLRLSLYFLREKLAVLHNKWLHHKLNEHFLAVRVWGAFNYFLFRGFVIEFAPQEFFENVWVHAECLCNFRGET